MNNNKKTIIICITLIILTLIFNNKISNTLTNILTQNFALPKIHPNEYSKKDNYNFFEIPKDNIPLSKKEILGIMFEAINTREESFTFYCPSEYQACLEDVKNITTDPVILMHLSNFVHPYNSFTSLTPSFGESGQINLSFEYLYEQEQIDVINNKVEEIINKTIKNDMDDYTKIQTIHDYIINNAKYDQNYETSKYKSQIAYGPLIEGYAICNGYADAMAIFLTKLGYNNYKIATTPTDIGDENATGHVWNAVLIDNEWKHLDLTWDDPVSNTNKDYLYHKYFLVNDSEMQEADSGKVVITVHNYNKAIYSEFKKID